MDPVYCINNRYQVHFAHLSVRKATARCNDEDRVVEDGRDLLLRGNEIGAIALSVVDCDQLRRAGSTTTLPSKHMFM